jgi:guanylate kinase
MPQPGQLVVFSGPSGVGKTTLLREVFVRARQPLVMSVSATTRTPRAGERDGEHYFFLTGDEFSRRRERGEFLECSEVFGRGHWYGTLQSEVAPRLAAGKWVVLEIDVDGAEQVLAKYPDALTIFISPESPEILEQRLRSRGTESEEAIARRLEVARRELERAAHYRFQVLNDQVDRAADEICRFLDEHSEVSSQGELKT